MDEDRLQEFPTPNGIASKNFCPRQTVGEVDRSATTAASSLKESSTGTGAGSPGVTWQVTSARGRRCGNADADTPQTAPGTRVFTRILADADAAGDTDWTVSVDATINRAHKPRDEHNTFGAAHRGHG